MVEYNEKCTTYDVEQDGIYKFYTDRDVETDIKKLEDSQES